MSSPKRRLLGICEAIIFAAMLGIGFPSQSFGTKASPPGQDLNPCDHLPDPPGKAKGIEKRCLSAGSSSGIAKGDFNGDGFADLAIGVPGKDTPSTVKDSGG
jgi:hypothetical protein